MLGGTEERLEGEQNAVVQRLGCPLHICASRIAQRALKIGDSSIHVLSRSQVSPIELPGRQEHVGRVSGRVAQERSAVFRRSPRPVEHKLDERAAVRERRAERVHAHVLVQILKRLAPFAEHDVQLLNSIGV